MDYHEFRKLISPLDPLIVSVLRSHLSKNLIPLKYEAIKSDAMKNLGNFPYVVLSFDLWMSVKSEDVFSISSHHCM